MDNKQIAIIVAVVVVIIAIAAVAVVVSNDDDDGKDTYTVTFDSNGGSTVSSVTVESGKTITKPTDPTKNGSTFDGWYTSSDLSTVYDFSTPVVDNIKLYAKWLNGTTYTGGLTADELSDAKSRVASDSTATVTVTSGDAKIVFDSAAVSAIDSAAELSVTTTDVPDSVKSVAGDSGVAYEITFGDNKEFGTGMLTISLPYSGSEKLVNVYYVKDNAVAGTYTGTCANGYVTFKVNHLSTYVIGGAASTDTSTAIGAVNTFVATYTGSYGSQPSVTPDSTDTKATLLLYGRSMSTMDHDGTPYYIYFEKTSDAAEQFNKMKKDLRDTMYTFMNSKLTFLSFQGYNNIFACVNDVASYGVTFTVFTIVAYHDDMLVYNVVYKKDMDSYKDKGVASNEVGPAGILLFGRIATTADNEELANAFLKSIGVTETVTIKEVQYVVSFVTNGGTNVARQKVSSGGLASYDYSIKDGYKFGGWYSDEALTQEFDLDTTPITSNIILYAKWIPLEDRTVTFTDATVTADGNEVTSGSKVKDLTVIVITPTAVEGKDAYVTANGTSLDIENNGTFRYTVDGTEDGLDVTIAVSYKDNTGAIGDNLTWTYDRTAKALTISGTGNMIDFNGSGTMWGGNEIVSLTIGNDVTSIGNYAFYHSRSLATVDFGTGIIKIGQYAFDGCSSLTSLTFPDSCLQILRHAFDNCTSLFTVTIGEGMTEIGETMGWAGVIYARMPSFDNDIHLYEIINHSSLDITAGAKEDNGGIAKYAVSVSESAETSLIKTDGDFKYVVLDGTCYVITYTGSSSSVSMPSKMGDYETYSIYDYAFYQSKITTVAMSAAVTGVGNYAFANSSLETAYVPALTNVGIGIFSGCSSLNRVTLTSGLTVIAESMFSGCRSLTSITIPDSVTTIGNNAFKNTGLTSITIPSSVTEIGESAFEGCSSLGSVTVPGTVKTIGKNVFASTGVTSADLSAITVVPEGILKSASKLTDLKLSDSTTSIGGSAFAGTALTSVVLPDTVTSLGGGIFSGCKSLTSVTLPSKITSIPNNMFLQTPSLTSITIPDGVTSIDKQAFMKSAIRSISLPSSLTTIGESAFQESSLITVVLPEGLTTIGKNAFNLSGVMSITIPSTVTSIGNSAFYHCYHLFEVINHSSFTVTAGQDAVTSSDGKSVKVYLGTNAKVVYNGTDSVESTVGTQGDFVYGVATEDGNKVCYLLNYLGSERSVVLPGTLGGYDKYVVDNNAFREQTIYSVTIPASVTSIEGGAFYGCSYLVEVINMSSISIVSGEVGKGAGYVADNALSVKTSGSSDIKSDGDYLYIVANDKCYLFRYTGASGIDLVLPDTLGGYSKYVVNQYSFYGFSFKSLTIPSSVESVGYSAFYNGSAPETKTLQFITIADGVELYSSSKYYTWISYNYFFDYDGKTTLNASDLAGFTYVRGGKTAVAGDSFIRVMNDSALDSARYFLHSYSGVYASDPALKEGSTDENATVTMTLPNTASSSIKTMEVHFIKSNDAATQYANLVKRLATTHTMWNMGNLTHLSISGYDNVDAWVFDGSMGSSMSYILMAAYNGDRYAYVFVDRTNENTPNPYSGLCNYSALATVADDTAVISALLKALGVTASIKLETHTVSFDTDGGSAISSVTVETGRGVSAPANPTKEGYVFDKWYTDKDCTTEYSFMSGMAMTSVTSDFTLYAKWNVSTYKVTFDSNEGSAVDPQTVEYGKTATKPETDPTKEGYTFSGWYSDKDLTKEYDFSSKVTSDLTLYAKWTASSTETPSTE